MPNSCRSNKEKSNTNSQTKDLVKKMKIILKFDSSSQRTQVTTSGNKCYSRSAEHLFPVDGEECQVGRECISKEGRIV